jgi:hypothetical protein
MAKKATKTKSDAQIAAELRQAAEESKLANRGSKITIHDKNSGAQIRSA